MFSPLFVGAWGGRGRFSASTSANDAFAARSERGRQQMRSVLVVLFAVVLHFVLWMGSLLLEFVSPLSNWIDLAGLLNLFLILGCGIVALWRRRWLTAVLSAIPFLLFIFTNRFSLVEGCSVARFGFSALALSDPEYFARCHLVAFEETGKKQQLGVCNAIHHPGTTTFSIYDSSGEIGLPVEQRSQAWTEAAMDLFQTTYFAKYERYLCPLSRDVYGVAMHEDEF
jgi:hypothetical protein